MKRNAVIIILLLSAFMLSADNNAEVSQDNNLQISSFGQLGVPSIQRTPNDAVLIKRILSNTVYRPTPGDSYQLIIKLDKVTSYILVLQQNYDLDVPYIGTVNAKKMTFMELRNLVQKKIKSSIPTDYVSFILSSPAQFDVFVYGGVKQPGMITANPLTRVWDAITEVKGLKAGASYRNVILFRNGVQRTIDLSQFNLHADISQNPTLQPGDKIYIPQAQIIVKISGKVRYPGIYELLPGEDLDNLIYYAGGATLDAEVSKIEITRFLQKNVSLMTVNLSEQGHMKIKNEDRVVIRGKSEKQGMIMIEGALYGKPISHDKPVTIPTRSIAVNIPYISGITLLDVLTQLGGPTPFADASASYIVRGATGEKIPLDVKSLWENQNRDNDIKLQADDYVLIPIKKLKVFVSGQVFNPGAFSYSSGYTVSDYLLAAGGINPDTGDKNKIFFVDNKGSRKHALLTSEVHPGDLIYVDKTSWIQTQKIFDNIVVITTFTTALITVTNLILNFVKQFQ
ncbi:MAG: hypothetical protein GXP33_14855 [Spirochaetes bacterium]|nr:hypothetical protein [Spirochaetota bacterium]